MSMNGISYKAVSELDNFQGTINPDDLILISRKCSDGSNGYKSNNTEVRNLAGMLSGELNSSMSGAVLSSLKKLAYMNPEDLNDETDITAFVRKDSGFINAGDFSAISSIQWSDGIITEVGSVSLSDVKASVTDTTSVGDVIAKIDGQQIFNGLSVEQKTTNGFEIAKINGTSIYGGQDTLQLQSTTSNGSDIIRVIKTSPSGSTSYTLKNGVNIQPTALNGLQTQTGDRIFTVNGEPFYNNLSVTSLVSNSNKLDAPIADINGKKIYNGVVLTGLATTGTTIAVINGQQIKNGTVINAADYKTSVSIQAGLTGKTIAIIDNQELKNGVNVDASYSSGVKIANIAGTNIYAPSTSVVQVCTSGVKIATVAGTDIYSPSSSAACITKTYRDGYDWYRIWSDGFCEQGGYLATTLGNKKTNTISLHQAYSSAQYTINVSRANPTGCGTPQGAANIVLDSATTTSFGVMSVCGTSHTAIYWETRGYIN